MVSLSFFVCFFFFFFVEPLVISHGNLKRWSEPASPSVPSKHLFINTWELCAVLDTRSCHTGSELKDLIQKDTEDHAEC